MNGGSGIYLNCTASSFHFSAVNIADCTPNGTMSRTTGLSNKRILLSDTEKESKGFGARNAHECVRTLNPLHTTNGNLYNDPQRNNKELNCENVQRTANLIHSQRWRLCHVVNSGTYSTILAHSHAHTRTHWTWKLCGTRSRSRFEIETKTAVLSPRTGKCAARFFPVKKNGSCSNASKY